MTNLERLQDQTYYELLTTISTSMHQRSFGSFSEYEALQIVDSNMRIPVQREPIISCDPETESPNINTISQAVRFIVPRVVIYINRNESSVSELIDYGHIVGLRHIYIHNYTGIGFSFWKPSSFQLKPIN